MLWIRSRLRLFTLLAAAWLAAAPAAAAPRYRVSKHVRGPQPEALRQLVHEGKYAEAMFLAADRPDLALSYFRWQAESPDARKKRLAEDPFARTRTEPRPVEPAETPEKRLAACAAYLRYFPCCDETALGSERMRQWAEVADRYVELCKQCGPTHGQSAEILRQNEGALALYQRLLDYPQKRQWEEFTKLVDRIVGEHPQSLFVPASAVLIKMSRGYGLPRPWPDPIFADLYQQIKQKSAPKETLVWLLLAQARDRFSTYSQASLKTALKNYQTAMELSDDSYVRAFCLLKQADCALYMPGADSPPLAQGLFRRYLAEYPHSGLAHRARFGLVEAYLAEKKLDEAERVARELEKAAPPGTSFAEEYLAIAEASAFAREYRKAIALSEEVIRRFPESYWLPTAYLQLGEAYEKIGDEKQMIETYQKAAAFSASPEGSRVPRSHDWHAAYAKLGKHYMHKGEWQKAIDSWGKWRPSEGSGQIGRALEVATCLAHLGRHRDAVCVCFQAIDRPPTDWAPELDAFLVRLYRDADQLPDLKNIVKQYEEAKIAESLKQAPSERMSPRQIRSGLPTHLVWELARVVELEREGNIAALIEICRQGRFDGHNEGGGPENCRARFAAEALASFGGREVSAIRQVIDTTQEDVTWLAYALGKSRSAEAFALLRELAAEEDLRWWSAVAYGLILQGDAGKQILEDIAQKKRHPRAGPARHYLEQFAPPAPLPPWPKPQPGSLPKDLGACLRPEKG